MESSNSNLGLEYDTLQGDVPSLRCLASKDLEQLIHSHKLAIEACLLSYKMHLENFIKSATPKTRLQTHTDHWRQKEEGVTDAYKRLESQLALTNAAYPELAAEGRKILAMLAKECKCTEEQSAHTVMGNLIHSWNIFIEKLSNLLSQGEDLLPNLETELKAFRTEVQTAMQNI